jgi:hypothetical protein
MGVDRLAPLSAAGPDTEGGPGAPFATGREENLLPTAPEQSPPPEPAHAVQAVTEKPASPRKGWWQRLIQS